MKITMVKKIMSDGTPCKKCIDVFARLEKSGHINSIDHVVEAREDDPASEGSLLAEFYQVDRAPFFIVEKENEEAKVYTIYFKLVKEVLEATD